MFVGAAVGAVMWMFSVFETVDASELKWTNHNMAIACRTVYELEKEMAKYTERLRFDKGLSPADREWINERITQIQKKIDRIDPSGDC